MLPSPREVASGLWDASSSAPESSARARKAQIKQNRIEGLQIQHAVRMLGRIGNVRRESEGKRDFAAGFADRSFVVYDQ